MSTHNTALHVNAWIPTEVVMRQLLHQLNPQLMLVGLHNGGDATTAAPTE